ncbi:family 16 glycosylhydrolase [Congregibacter brevis]|uniref:Family 16 glycosylhydrolase n=1 Tax=Congregibacter brevis TaxID=3081201 RepID=A0ABZ0IBX3_9GAMM|nr:family 16 glycosylhydrolase [Congregibacter sp. IMCC45268]
MQIAPALLLIAIAAPTLADLPQAYPGYTGVYRGFSLVLDDRFDSFNNAVWYSGDGAVGKEAMCRFQDQGTRITGGNLELIVDKRHVPGGWSEDHQKLKDPYDYVCGEVRTRPGKRILYGRVETRMRAPDRQSASGYISSLFTYVNEGNRQFDREWEEIDIELEGGRPDAFQANLIYGLDAEAWSETRRFGAWEHKIDVGPVDTWRVFAIEWLPKSIKWFVDGKLIKTLSAADIDCDPSCIPPQQLPTPIPDTPADVMINFWIPNDDIEDIFGGNKDRNEYPMRSRYDWLRIYQYDAQPLENWAEQAAQIMGADD